LNTRFASAYSGKPAHIVRNGWRFILYVYKIHGLAVQACGPGGHRHQGIGEDSLWDSTLLFCFLGHRLSLSRQPAICWSANAWFRFMLSLINRKPVNSWKIEVGFGSAFPQIRTELSRVESRTLLPIIYDLLAWICSGRVPQHPPMI
jgi:hypothetical protein